MWNGHFVSHSSKILKSMQYNQWEIAIIPVPMWVSDNIFRFTQENG